MKEPLQQKLGRFLIRRSRLRICIVDDEEACFPPLMLEVAESAGYTDIERLGIVDNKTLKRFLADPPDIFILDIKGVVTPDVAKSGFDLAKLLHEETAAFIVITSAHKFHLKDYHKSYDYVLNEKMMTAVEFIGEIAIIVDKYLSTKVRCYQKLVLKAGFKLGKRAVLPTGD
ncbi:MAG: hypothetical protein J7K65_05740 [Planctomycetes bacterium]|nr:hypothetical protein [Planctomycetota bacterium]